MGSTKSQATDSISPLFHLSAHLPTSLFLLHVEQSSCHLPIGWTQLNFLGPRSWVRPFSLLQLQPLQLLVLPVRLNCTGRSGATVPIELKILKSRLLLSLPHPWTPTSSPTLVTSKDTMSTAHGSPTVMGEAVGEHRQMWGSDPRDGEEQGPQEDRDNLMHLCFLPYEDGLQKNLTINFNHLIFNTWQFGTCFYMPLLCLLLFLLLLMSRVNLNRNTAQVNELGCLPPFQTVLQSQAHPDLSPRKYNLLGNKGN